MIFLQNRKYRSLVKSHTTEWMDTSLGVPQGSSIVPLLFIKYTSDLLANLGPHMKYADDNTLWEIDKQLNIAIRKVGNKPGTCTQVDTQMASANKRP